ncbi:MAG: hypothetical protein IMZ50_07810 [Candidatus Atribacteria bacterium]|nr:hypothetical protein [Candidatus Atribacteria bacterium]
MTPEKNSVPRWTRATRDEVIELIRRVHGKDLSLFDESFLTKSLEKRLAATSTEAPEAYRERLEKDRTEYEHRHRRPRVTIAPHSTGIPLKGQGNQDGEAKQGGDRYARGGLVVQYPSWLTPQPSGGPVQAAWGLPNQLAAGSQWAHGIIRKLLGT